MATGTSRKETLEFIARFASCVVAAGERTSRHWDVGRLQEIIREQEKEHRAFGRRLVGPDAVKGRFSVSAAVDYFTTRTIADAVVKGGKDPGARPMRDMVGTRWDYVIAAILVADPGFLSTLTLECARAFPGESLADVCKRAFALDYAELVS